MDITKTIDLLLQDEDTDHDRKITVDDFPVKNTDLGDKRFVLKARDHRSYEIDGTYYLANLLQELTLKKDAGKKTAALVMEHIFENPVHRISRMIRELYWHGLTRRIDAEYITKALYDSKIADSPVKYIYIPYQDSFAFDYFSKVSQNLSSVDLRVVRLPEEITPRFVHGLEGKHGLLPLALEQTPAGEIRGKPFVVPGGRFNEMYGWDSYFESLGLIADGKIQLARDMVDNFVYEINHYGKILNANRSYYLTRSQPPFLTSMALAVYNRLPKTDASRQWIEKVLLAAIKEYHTVWMNSDHLTPTGLSRYYGTGIGIPPEVEEGHFDAVLEPYSRKHHLSLSEFSDKYQKGLINEPELDQFFVNDRAMRESGHDTTYRWRIHGTDQCADFVTVDLNALLYKYELDIAMTIQDVFDGQIGGETAEHWFERAKTRKERILNYLWNPEKQIFYDYYLPDNKQSDYISATAFYPLWACYPNHPETKILNQDQADAFIRKALTCLETNGGVLSGAKASLEKYGIKGVERQWDYPNGWAPLQWITYKGLKNYGKTALADTIAERWINLNCKVFFVEVTAKVIFS